MGKKRKAVKHKKAMSKKNAELVQYDTTEKEGREDSKRDERVEREQYENLERDLTYAKSEIGRLALRFLKNTTLPQRIAGVALVVMLSLGVGVAVGIYQNHFLPFSGTGVVEKGAQKKADNGSGDANGENQQGEDSAGTEKISWEDVHAGMKTVAFTKGEDGVYRAHVDGENFTDRSFIIGYVFDIPADLHKPTEPYVIHVHNQGNSVGSREEKMQIIYSRDGDFYQNDSSGFPDFYWSVSDTSDFFFPFFHKNTHGDDEFAMLSVKPSLTMDIELLPAGQAQLRTWDGHSKLQQSDSELFRVTGPITASQVEKSESCAVELYGWRPGDGVFHPLLSFEDGISIEGDAARTVTFSKNIMREVELLWVDNECRNSNVWTIR